MSVQLPPFDEALRQQAAKPWRVLIVLGSSVLILGFFTAGYVMWTDPKAMVDAVAVFLMIAAGLSPFLLGVLGAALGGLAGKPKWMDFCIGAMSALTIICGIWLCMAGGMSAIATSGRFSWRIAIPALVAALVGAIMLAGLHRIWRRVPPQRRASQISFWVSVPIAGISILLAAAFDQFRAAQVMWAAGSVLLLLGCVREAAALTRRAWWDILWRLPLCCLTDAPLTPGTCPGCGYNLYGLREQRCPECGRPFSFAEIGVTPEQIGFVPPDDEANG